MDDPDGEDGGEESEGRFVSGEIACHLDGEYIVSVWGVTIAITLLFGEWLACNPLYPAHVNLLSNQKKKTVGSHPYHVKGWCEYNIFGMMLLANVERYTPGVNFFFVMMKNQQEKKTVFGVICYCN